MNIDYLRKLVLEILTEDQKSLKFSKQRLEGLILEVLAENKRGRAMTSDFMDKYPEYSDQIQTLADADPSKGPQKYLPWSVFQLTNADESPKKIIDAIQKFHDLQARGRIEGDLNNLSKENYPTLSYLVGFVDEILSVKTTAQRRKEIRLQAIKETEILKLPENLADRYILVSPKTHKSSCYWGRGTKWCTAGKDDMEFVSHTIDDNGVLYYIIDKTLKSGKGGDPDSKIAFFIPIEDEYEKLDQDVIFSGLKEKMPDMEIFDALDKAKNLSQIPEDHEEIFLEAIWPWHIKLKESIVLSYQKEKTKETFEKLGIEVVNSPELGSRWKGKVEAAFFFDLKKNFSPDEINEMRFDEINAGGLDLEGADYSSIDLRGIDFRQSTLSGANLFKTKLDRAKLQKTKLNGANLAGASITNAQLLGTKLVDAVLNFANLKSSFVSRSNFKGAQMEGADLNYVVFEKCDIRDADLSTADMSWASINETVADGAIFREADFEKASILKSSLKGADFSGVKVQETVLRKSDFSGGDFSGASLERVNVVDSHFREAKLTEVKVAEGKWNRVALTRADLDGADIINVTWATIVGEGMRLRGGRLENSLIEKSMLKGADFSGSSFQKSAFVDCYLGGANFSGAKLKGVDFSGSDLTGANIKDADFDTTTVWPQSFEDDVYEENVRTGKAARDDGNDDFGYNDEEDDFGYNDEEDYYDEENEDSLFDDPYDY
jgi:uncharacterized protein YjbI with pentapeptide repeats